MKISTSGTTIDQQKKDAVILFFQGEKPLIDKTLSELITLCSELIKSSSFKGQSGQTAVFPLAGQIAAKRLILAGVGEAKYFDNGILEKAAGAAIRAGRDAGATTFAMPSGLPIDGMDDGLYRLLAGRGAVWGSYDFSTFKSDSRKTKPLSLTFAGKFTSKISITYATEQGAALLDTADLANLPGNEAPPEKIASWARIMAKQHGMTCQVLGKAELTKKGCGGILSVAQGSAQDARMVILRHKGTDPKARPIVLVGKTVTFDSGGISLKPGKGMGWMRYDKCGGMAVLAAMQMIARMNVKTPVVGILGAAENMPGSNATRPGDIIKAYNGKTIEVLNTDAEGRLVLADALGLAADLKPRAIVDLATLTGAVIVALGSAASAVLGNDETLVSDLIAAGNNAGERLWQLPLYKEYSDDMKSDFADISNICKSSSAGTATAAAFLQEFVPEDIPWAHIDIAGTAWLESAKPHQAPGATLFGARLLAQWIESLNA
ncbi:MAG: leucyl aminopeptidase [Pontiellaceae bacterium]|nr:leucyl aminopeptidase [Pontiellaceae bacterium]MBN2786143.1 leucyl aminopeptidase [Pontiellaceae bacterium]